MKLAFWLWVWSLDFTTPVHVYTSPNTAIECRLFQNEMQWVKKGLTHYSVDEETGFTYMYSPLEVMAYQLKPETRQRCEGLWERIWNR